MSNNVILNAMSGGQTVETLDTGAGLERQVITISPRDLSSADSIGALTETAPTTDTASSGLNGRLQRVAQRMTSLIALQPAALGSTAAASSFATTASTEDVARQGIITETAPATDTASSGQNGRLQRIAQRLTSLIALFPTALGSTAAASSLAVTQSTEDVARQGIVTETAPATDTASSGQNGRLQRIAQRLTSLIAQVPATLGQKAMSASLAVVIASDQSAVPTSNFATTVSVTVTRPANTTAYTASQVWSTSTTAPTVGGNVVTGAGRASGGSGLITDLVITNSANAALQGELWIFDTTVTAVNDGAAWALADADVLKLVGVVPFLTTVQPSNGACWIPALGMGFTCSGSANLIFLIKLTAAYTPISGEVFQVRFKIQQVT